MAKDEPRRCKRCDYAWYAVRVDTTVSKPRWFDESFGPANMVRRASNYEHAMAQKERWAKCPNCGSTAVKTVTSRRFEPTGAIKPTSASPPPAPSSSPDPPVVTVPRRTAPRPPAPPQLSTRSIAVRCACGATAPVGQKFCGACGAAMPVVIVAESLSSAREPGLDGASDFIRSDQQPAWKAYEENLEAAKAAGDRRLAKDLRAVEGQRLRGLNFKETMAEARAKTKENTRKAREQRGT